MNKIGKNKIKMLLIGIFFGFVNLFSLTAPVQNTYAEPLTDLLNNMETAAGITETTEETTTESTEQVEKEKETVPVKDVCKEGLKQTAWLMCPKTKTGADAVDFLYKSIEGVLAINPIRNESGDVIQKIWEVCRGITNIVFAILMLLVVISQITGYGISNYGIKRALPKLLIAAVAVNLSFVICQYAVDISNTLGVSIRNLFASIESSVLGTTEVYNFHELTHGLAEYYDGMANGAGALALAGVTFETGAIFVLIPAVLVCLVAVLSGLLTIALRHVVVVLCVMIAPLAMVAMIFPNTANLFRKWRHTLTSMLVFFPMFSLLFGASSLAGFAITQAAGTDGVMSLIGTIIQLAPLILCWKMMKMSGTVLGGVHSTVSGVLSGLFVNPARRYAASLAMHRRARTLAQVNPYTPSAKLMQYLEDRRISREMDIAEYSQYAKQRAAAFNSNKKYKFNKKGQITAVTKDGIETYSMQANAIKFQQEIQRDKNAMEQGLGTIETIKNNKEVSDKDKALLDKLDVQTVKAADALFTEQIKANDIAYRNALSRAVRFDQALNAHVDSIHRNETGYRPHYNNSMTRYNEIVDIMGNKESAYYAIASASSAAEAQKSIRQGQFQRFFDATVPTQDVVNRLKDLTTSSRANDNMDAIISGMRTLNQRGDHELLKDAIDDLMSDEKVKLGTSASQMLANFLIAEVKDSNPMLKRFGKYLNLETARYFNTDKIAEGKQRRRQTVDFDEYVLDGYDVKDENGNYMYDPEGNILRDAPKRGMTQLLYGTSFKAVEREGFSSIFKSISKACKGNDNLREKVNDAVYNAILPNIVGDQFNYASGSEQIISFTKSITGAKPIIRDNKIVGYEWDEDTLKQFHSDPEKAKEIALRRTNTLLNAEVANQALRQKSDFIGAAGFVYRQEAEKAFLKKEHSQLYKEWTEWEKDCVAHGYEIDESKKNPNAEDPEDFEKNRFAHYLYRKQFKPSVLVAMAKQFNKGYAGDSKENTYEMLGMNDFKDSKLTKDLAGVNNGNNNQNAQQKQQKQPQQPSAYDAHTVAMASAIISIVGKKFENDPDFLREVEENERELEAIYAPQEVEPQPIIDDDDDDDDGDYPVNNEPDWYTGSASEDLKQYTRRGGDPAQNHKDFAEHARELGLDAERQARIDRDQEGYAGMKYIDPAEMEVRTKNNLK